MRLIDADEFQEKLAGIAKLAKSDKQKSIIGRAMYCLNSMPTIGACEKPKTNADRIRAMSDEALAEFLVTVETHGYYDQSVSGTFEMIEWLNQKDMGNEKF